MEKAYFQGMVQKISNNKSKIFTPQSAYPDFEPLPVWPPEDPNRIIYLENKGEKQWWAKAVDTLNDWKSTGTYIFDIDYQLKVVPGNACAGKVITITGKGFGNKSGKVRFRSKEGTGIGSAVMFIKSPVIDVNPLTWTDTKITVIVPKEAVCGLLSVRIPTGTKKVNGKFIDTYKGIGPAKFDGSLPEVTYFHADGVSNFLITHRGAIVKLSWEVCPANSKVAIKVMEGSSHLWTKKNYPSKGTDTLPVGGVVTTDYTCTLTATNTCGSSTRKLVIRIHRPARVFMTGLEVTQATQYYGGISSSSAQKPGNTVPLFVGKATLARAYFASDQDPSFNQGQVKGVDIALRGYIVGGGELPGSPLKPINAGPYTANNTSNDRADLTRSANFRIPSSWMIPKLPLRFVAELTLDPKSDDSINTSKKAFTVEGINFQSSRTLDCVVVRVDYQGPPSTAPRGAPTLAQTVNTLHFVRRVFPTHRLRIFFPNSNERVLSFGGNLGSSSGGGCGGWSVLLDEIQDIAKGYDNDDDMVWCAALRMGIPTNVASGCGSGSRSYALGYAAFRVTDNTTAAQEVAHAFDRDHTFDDSNYPKYGFTDSDSIGEFGVDVERSTPFNPATVNNNLYNPFSASDYMSYDNDPLWTSPYTYIGLMKRFFATKASAGKSS